MSVVSFFYFVDAVDHADDFPRGASRCDAARAVARHLVFARQESMTSTKDEEERVVRAEGA